jgi:hypothetical protein
LDNHAVWANASDGPNYLATEFDRGHEVSITMAKEFDGANPEDVRRSTLFTLTQWPHLIARSVIKTALITVGEQAIVNFDTRTGPGFDGAASAEIGVIWVGGYE